MIYFKYFIIGLLIGGAIALKIKQQQKEEIANLKNRNKELLEQNRDLNSANARYKIFTETIKNRVELIEKRENRRDTWFGSLLQHNPEQPFDKETIAKLLAENKLKDFDK